MHPTMSCAQHGPHPEQKKQFEDEQERKDYELYSCVSLLLNQYPDTVQSSRLMRHGKSIAYFHLDANSAHVDDARKLIREHLPGPMATLYESDTAECALFY